VLKKVGPALLAYDGGLLVTRYVLTTEVKYYKITAFALGALDSSAPGLCTVSPTLPEKYFYSREDVPATKPQDDHGKIKISGEVILPPQAPTKDSTASASSK
jgi:hypothetical protein